MIMPLAPESDPDDVNDEIDGEEADLELEADEDVDEGDDTVPDEHDVPFEEGNHAVH